MKTANGNSHYEDSFYTPAYGAYRWDKYLTSRPGTWYLVSKNPEFDWMRGVPQGSAHITCVVDDFGDLVKVTP